MKLYIEVDILEDNLEAFKILVDDLKTVVDFTEIKFHIVAPGGIDVEKLKEFLQGILSDPHYSRNLKFADDTEYRLYVELVKLVKAPLIK